MVLFSLHLDFPGKWPTYSEVIQVQQVHFGKGSYLEDHPRTCKWLITMVVVSPPRRVVGPLPNGLNGFVNRGDPMVIRTYLLSVMILQAETPSETPSLNCNSSPSKINGWEMKMSFRYIAYFQKFCCCLFRRVTLTVTVKYLLHKTLTIF